MALLLFSAGLALFPPSAAQDVSLPAPVVMVSAGERHTCVLLATSTVDCRGYNLYGQAEDYLTPGVTSVSAGGDLTCVQLVGNRADCWGYGSTQGVSDMSDVASVAAGGFHFCGLLLTGNVDCKWEGGGGTGSWGEAADYSGGDAIAVDADFSHTCVLLATGNAECYGGTGSWGE